MKKRTLTIWVVLASAFIAFSFEKNNIPAPSALMCEYMPNPEKTFITNPHPVFSWIFNTNRTNQYQSAYQIIIASSKDNVEKNIGDRWDSKKVKSDESACVIYNGQKLESNKDYWWKVRIWNDAGDSSVYSEAQKFCTGDFSYIRKWPYESRLIKTIIDGNNTYYCFENRAPLIYHEVDPDKIIKRSDAYFVDFGKSAFATLKIKTKLLKPGIDSLRICIGEKRTNDSVHRKPGGSLIFIDKTFFIDKTQEEYIIDLPRFVPRYPHSLSLPDYMKDVKPFRYCEIYGIADLKKNDLKQLALYIDYNEKASSFTSSNANLNAVYDLCKYSVMVNTFNGDYASSERERMMYEADTYIHQLGHYACERQYATARYSNIFQMFHASWPTEWIPHSIFIAHADFMQTGDTTLLATYYDELKHKTLLQLTDSNYLVSTINKKQSREFLQSIYYNGDKLKDIVDWPPASFSGGKYGEQDNYVFTEFNTVVNAFHYKSLLLMAEIAKAANKTGDTLMYVQRAKRVRDAFNQLFFDQSKKYYVDGSGTDHSSLHANMFALAFGLVDEGNKKSVIDFIKLKGMACSVYGAQYLLEALFDANEAQYAMDLITAEHDRSWINMLKTGSTITTEAWDLKYKQNGSWTHAWSTSPVHIIPRKIIGIEPLEPGFKTIRIMPKMGNLKNASMELPTIRGIVGVTIQQNDKEYIMQVTIPGNTKAYLYLPKMKEGKIFEMNPGYKFLGIDGERFVYQLGSGVYKFISR